MLHDRSEQEEKTPKLVMNMGRISLYMLEFGQELEISISTKYPSSFHLLTQSVPLNQKLDLPGCL